MIAILGWGSLLWEIAPEFDRWREHWQFDGPTLPVEFTRISDSRLGALTLVIDPKCGVPTKVAWCLSKRTALEDVACDLRCREGTTIGNIGTHVIGNAFDGAPPTYLEEINRWGTAHQVRAVVWTALRSNFEAKLHEPFSIEAAKRYLRSLGPEAKAKAAEYVWRAPDSVVTELRSQLQREPWFS